MSEVINGHAKGRVYIQCATSSVTKMPKVCAPSMRFKISAMSRGKELMITLQPTDRKGGKPVFVLCGMGLTGFFEVAPSSEMIHKHAHLCFHATDKTVLCLVDQMRFGTWRSLAQCEWSADRGPCPVKEYTAFRQNVARAVAAKPTNFEQKPICQVLHDQRLFNGIGNYLRAEVLLRAGVAPFAPAKSVLGNLPAVPGAGHKPDLLTLCQQVPKEVIRLGLTKYQGPQDSGVEHGKFERWLRVYGREDALWAVDQQNRRIWFRGAKGALYERYAKKGKESESKPKKNKAAPESAMKKAAGVSAKKIGKKATRENKSAPLTRKTVLKKRPARVVKSKSL